MQQVTEFWLIRHAPAATGGLLAGRRDVGLVSRDFGPCAGAVDRVIASPAVRCVQTAAALFPGHEVPTDPRLWEQDFGAWEGCDPAALPDLGPLSAEALATHRPGNGESFADVCARVWPALDDCATGGRVAVVAHAGTIRAALARALDRPAAGLAFQIAPLSLTRITASPAGWAISLVNGPLP